MKPQIVFIEFWGCMKRSIPWVLEGLRTGRFMRIKTRALLFAGLSCVFLWLFTVGAAACSFDVSGINNTTSEVCGNGVVEGDEDCDGEDMNGLLSFQGCSIV